MKTPGHTWFRVFFGVLCLPLLHVSPTAAKETPQRPKPNIVLILADDLGYGDVRAFNPTSRIATPHLDKLASQGMMFTDAHSGSAVCTPTRYGLLTGRHAWRTRLQSGVLGGFSPPLISEGRLTVPLLLRRHGYATACIGKWHLGMTWPQAANQAVPKSVLEPLKDETALDSVAWDQPIRNGPLSVGFDSFFGISASLDMPPFVFIRDRHATTVPTVLKKWIRSGPASVDFEAEDVLPRLTAEAVSLLRSRAAAARGTPFFLYLALTSPHTPVVPSKSWRGRSGLGSYADFVMETDEAAGEVLAALESNGLAQDTLVIFTSDNGFAPQGDPEGELRKQGHAPSANFRGYKSDIWEGGHRVPFIARWPGRIKSRSRCDQPLCLTDLMASCAELLDTKLPPNSAEDSVSFLPALMGRKTPSERKAIVHHSIQGRFAIREGSWKLVFCPGSGGWSKPSDSEAKRQGSPAIQLYDLAADPSETNNLAADMPDLVARLTNLMETYVREGRSTPGPLQTNDVLVTYHSKETATRPGTRQGLLEGLHNKDAPAVKGAVEEIRKELGDKAGVPDVQDRYTRIPPAAPQFSREEATGRFTRDLAAIERLRWWKVGVDPTQLTQPLRVPASVLGGCVAVIRGKLDDNPRVRQTAEQAAEFLLWTQAQAGSGGFPFPAAEGTSAAQAMKVGTKFLEKVRSEGRLQDVVRNGWVFDDLGDGGLQFDNGECGVAIFEYYELTRDSKHLASARESANWAVNQPLCANWNYNSFSVWLLATAFEVTGERRYLDAAREKALVGVIPGQLRDGPLAGRWVDPHNARPAYHYIMVRALAKLAQVLPPEDQTRPEIIQALSLGLRTRNQEIIARGAMTRDKAIEALLVTEQAFTADNTFLQETQTTEALAAMCKLVSQQAQQGAHPLEPREWGMFLAWAAERKPQAEKSPGP